MVSKSSLGVRVVAFVVVLFCLQHGALSHDKSWDKTWKEEAEEVKKAIKEKGVHWEVRDTPAFPFLKNQFPPTGAVDDTNAWKAQLSADKKKIESLPVHNGKNISMPRHWDWRKQSIAKTCTSIVSVRNQGNCGSCWAVSAASMISDRYCLYNNGSRGQVYFSAFQLVSCVPKGGTCDGGSVYEAAKYWQSCGLVSGGDPSAGEPLGCMPYPRSFKKGQHFTCPTCGKEKRPKKPCYKDKIDGKGYEVLLNRNPSPLDLQYNILNNGPIVASFIVYGDFMHYKSGVYEHVRGDKVGLHAIKLIGWGTDHKGKDYWIGSNSWGRDWGEGGFFKIRRGVRECGIENSTVGVGKIKTAM